MDRKQMIKIGDTIYDLDDVRSINLATHVITFKNGGVMTANTAIVNFMLTWIDIVGEY